jgi:hypothetical protein
MIQCVLNPLDHRHDRIKKPEEAHGSEDAYSDVADEFDDVPRDFDTTRS